MSRGRRIRRILLFLLVSFGPWAALRVPAVQDALLRFVETARGSGAAGVAMFVAGVVLGSALMLPFVLLTAFAGFIFGFAAGLPIALVGVVLGASLAFTIGRLAGRRLLAAWSAESPFGRTIEALMDEEGARVALLMRFTPFVPQNMMSYLFGATSLSASRFGLTTLLGLLPVTGLNVYLGSLVESAIVVLRGGVFPGGNVRAIAAVVGLAIAATTVLTTARMAKRQMEKIMREHRERAAT